MYVTVLKQGYQCLMPCFVLWSLLWPRENVCYITDISLYYDCSMLLIVPVTAVL